MSTNFYSEKIVTAHKKHNCAYCGSIIYKGVQYRRETGKHDGKFFSYCCCTKCMPHTAAFWDYVDGETGNILEDFTYFCKVEG